MLRFAGYRLKTSTLCSRVFYTTPSNSNIQFLIDTRFEKNKRKVVDRRTLSNTQLRVEISDDDDRDLLSAAMLKYFFPTCPLYCNKPDFAPENLASIGNDIVKNCAGSGASLLAIDENNNRLVGFMLTHYLTGDNIPKVLGPLTPGKPVEWKKEHGKTIDAIGAEHRSAAQLQVMLSAVEANLGRFLDPKTKKVIMGEIVGVHPDYGRIGIGAYLFKIAEMLVRKNGVHQALALTVAKASFTISSRDGWNLLFSIPVDDFLDHGKAVFADTTDGSTLIHAIGKGTIN